MQASKMRLALVAPITLFCLNLKASIIVRTLNALAECQDRRCRAIVLPSRVALAVRRQITEPLMPGQVVDDISLIVREVFSRYQDRAWPWFFSNPINQCYE
jgi:hypothetical protein